jgi:hypothetical protein
LLLLDILETALVLFWRHLDYYLGQYPGLLDTVGAQAGLNASRFGRSGGLNGLNGSQSSFRSTVGPTAADFNQSQSQLSKNFKPTLAEAQALKRDVGHIVLSTLDDIMGLDLVSFHIFSFHVCSCRNYGEHSTNSTLSSFDIHRRKKELDGTAHRGIPLLRC